MEAGDMFGSTILDIVIGMVFVFLLLSLVCSAVNELIETVLKNRAKDLELGIKELFGDPATSGDFLKVFYNHGLINSLFKGTYQQASKRDLPSYIPPITFALAVMDLVHNPPTPDFALPPNLQAAYTVIARQVGGDAAKLQAGLEEWFNNRMDRVAGWYKRRVQWILVALGLIVAVAVNADTIQIARLLSNSASLRQGLVASAQAQASQSLSSAATSQASPTPEAAVKQIQDEIAGLGAVGLPIGWQASDLTQADKAPAAGWMKRSAVFVGQLAEMHLLGWLLTAIAISMGAPFWFDLLNRFISVRSTLKPQSGDGAAQAATPPQPIIVTLTSPPTPSLEAPPPSPPPALPAGSSAPPTHPASVASTSMSSGIMPAPYQPSATQTTSVGATPGVIASPATAISDGASERSAS
jgi:hypothetical protein